MIGTIIAGSTAAFLAGTAALELVDGMIDRRRLQLSRPQRVAVAAPRQTLAPVAAGKASNEPEILLKAA